MQSEYQHAGERSRNLASSLILIVAFVALPAVAQVRASADAKATINLDAVAAAPKSRAAGPPRPVHRPMRPALARRPLAQSPEPALSAAAPTPPDSGNASYIGFPAIADNFTAIPPDTNGAVSPQDVVTMLNTQMQIQSRTGALRSGYPIALAAFWSGLGNFTDVFDPRIVYDAAANRWIASTALNGSKATSALLLGVSQTSNPGGNWNLFQFNINQPGTAAPAAVWADYPILGFNGNWVTVSLNIFKVAGSEAYVRTDLYVFNKQDLYSSGSQGAHTVFGDDFGEGFVPALDYDNHPDTFYFVQTFSADFGVLPGQGVIRITTLQGPVGSETCNGQPTTCGPGQTIVLSQPWNDTGPDNGADFAPQLGTSTRIDTGDSRLQNCVLRGGNIWCTHTIFLPYGVPTRSAVQWFQIDPSAPQIVQLGRIDDPTATYFYAYPSIAVNRNHDALIGYNRFSSGDYASALFAFRTAADPPGAVEPAVIYKHGEAPYINFGARTGSNRWGDFSSTWVDPADDLSFWTIQEYASTPPSSGLPPGQNGKFGTWWVDIEAPSVSANCAYAISPASNTVSNGGGSGTLAVSSSPGCEWMAASNAPWITIGAPGFGTGSGSASYTVVANSADAAPRTGTVSVAGQTFTLTQGTAAAKPGFTLQGVVNAASYQGGAIAPGEVITIFGSNLGPPVLATPTVSAAGVVDTSAGGTQVLFDGVPAPMVYAISTQVTAVVPFGLRGKTSTQVQAVFLGTPSDPIAVPVAAAAPGIFSLDSSGKGQAAILNQDNSVNGASNPAARGSVIVIYATGGGAMPGAVQGTLAQTAVQVNQLPVTVHIGGVAATAVYAGTAPGLITGVLQINVVVPPSAAAGSAVPITITVGAVTSAPGPTVALR